MLAKSGLTILRLVSRCLASCVNMRLSMDCFCISSCCWACPLCCSWAILCCISSILRRRISSSSGSSISSSLNLFFHPGHGYFLSSGWVFSSCLLMSAANLSSVRLPSPETILPLLFAISTRPADSSCCSIFLMLAPPPFLTCSRMAPFLWRPPYSARSCSMPIGPCM